MKRILFIIAFCSPLLAQAQSIEHILKSIEQNNKELKAQKHVWQRHFSCLGQLSSFAEALKTIIL